MKDITKPVNEKEEFDLPIDIIKNKYLQKFANKMMLLSNRLNEVDDDFRDDWDIKEDYQSDIQEFIFKLTGL